MALSQCAALMGDVPSQRARSGPGPLGRKRLQGGTKQPPPGIHCLSHTLPHSQHHIRNRSHALSLQISLEKVQTEHCGCLSDHVIFRFISWYSDDDVIVDKSCDDYSINLLADRRKINRQLFLESINHFESVFKEKLQHYLFPAS